MSVGLLIVGIEGVREDNTSGVTGVYWSKGDMKWRSRISYNNCRISLGMFLSFDEAVCARLKAEDKYNYGV